MTLQLLDAIPTLATALRAAVPATVQVWDHVPETPAPPCVIIEPGDDFLSEDDQGSFRDPTMIATLDLFLLVRLDDEHDNAKASAQLVELLPAMLDTIRELDDVWIASMGKPQAFLTTEWVHHGMRVTVQTRVEPSGVGVGVPPVLDGGLVATGHGAPDELTEWTTAGIYFDVDSGDVWRKVA